MPAVVSAPGKVPLVRAPDVSRVRWTHVYFVRLSARLRVCVRGR